jgi:hypothetical protein
MLDSRAGGNDKVNSFPEIPFNLFLIHSAANGRGTARRGLIDSGLEHLRIDPKIAHFPVLGVMPMRRRRLGLILSATLQFVDRPSHSKGI